MDCHYCDKQAVLSGGKPLCVDHLYLYDKGVLINYVQGIVTKTLTDILTIEKFFMWAFGTVNPTLSMLPMLYEGVPRGKWDETRRKNGGFGYDESQESYVRKCYLKFLREDKGK